MEKQPFRQRYRRWYCRLFGGAFRLYMAWKR